MAKEITITNGSGTSNIINGEYSVSANVNGYDNSSINPSTVQIISGTDTYNFTIKASGTLTLHVSEGGTSSSTVIVGATFVRTDESGTQYGEEITTDAEGNAVFNNVPYASSNAPTIYFKQIASDGEHEFSSEVQDVTMNSETQTVEIQNTLGALRTLNLTDEIYTNLPVDGTILLTK